MKVYLAARYENRQEIAMYAEMLKLLGYEITSRWVFGNHEASVVNGVTGDRWNENGPRFALEDYQDLIAADMVISFTEEHDAPKSRGGRHVEFGMAVALKKLLVVVGPRENVFHWLPVVRLYRTWEEAFTWLEEVRIHANALSGSDPLSDHRPASRGGDGSGDGSRPDASDLRNDVRDEPRHRDDAPRIEEVSLMPDGTYEVGWQAQPVANRDPWMQYVEETKLRDSGGH